MWALIWAVTEDLATFAYTSLRGWFVTQVDTEAAPKLLTVPTPPYIVPREIMAQEGRAIATPRATTLSTPAPTSVQVSLESKNTSRPLLQKSTVMYTASPATALYELALGLGPVLTSLPYGSMVMVLDAKEEWAKVAQGAYVGWVHVDDLEDCAADVYPSFRKGEENGADAVSTTRVRAVIQDEFGAGEAHLPLQAEEYVTYRLLRKGKRIEWPEVRPRTLGVWHTILNDTPNVECRAVPSQGALMEFTMESEDAEGVAGHVAFVEAVFPDDTIQISEANWPDRGIYSERVLPLEEWQALNPVFLVVE